MLMKLPKESFSLNRPMLQTLEYNEYRQNVLGIQCKLIPNFYMTIDYLQSLCRRKKMRRKEAASVLCFFWRHYGSMWKKHEFSMKEP